MLKIKLYSNIDYIQNLSRGLINPVSALPLNDRTGFYNFYNLYSYGTGSFVTKNIAGVLNLTKYYISVDSNLVYQVWQPQITIAGVTGSVGLNGTYTYQNGAGSAGTYDTFSTQTLRVNTGVPASGVWGNNGTIAITANPLRSDASWNGVRLYTYNAITGQWYYSDAGIDYVDINTLFYGPTFLTPTITYNIPLSLVTGGLQTGNWPQGIFVMNVVYIGLFEQQAVPTIGVCANVICRKLQELADDILYQRACKGKCKQYDDLSRVWNLCYQQLLRTQIDFESYVSFDISNISALNESLITNNELGKAVSLYKEALAIAEQDIDCNGCK